MHIEIGTPNGLPRCLLRDRSRHRILAQMEKVDGERSKLITVQ